MWPASLVSVDPLVWPPGARENFCKLSRGGMCHVPCATNRPMTGTIVVPAFRCVGWCHAGSDRTSRSGAIPENSWTHIHPDWLTDWLTNTSGQLFFTDPPKEIFVHRTFNAKAFERSFTTILDNIGKSQVQSRAKVSGTTRYFRTASSWNGRLCRLTWPG